MLTGRLLQLADGANRATCARAVEVGALFSAAAAAAPAPLTPLPRTKRKLPAPQNNYHTKNAGWEAGGRPPFPTKTPRCKPNRLRTHINASAATKTPAATHVWRLPLKTQKQEDKHRRKHSAPQERRTPCAPLRTTAAPAQLANCRKTNENATRRPFWLARCARNPCYTHKPPPGFQTLSTSATPISQPISLPAYLRTYLSPTRPPQNKRPFQTRTTRRLLANRDPHDTFGINQPTRAN